MLTLQSPVMEKLITVRKTGRRPLQPINTISPNVPPPPINSKKPNPKLGLIEIISDDSSNKENPNPNSNKQNERCEDPVMFEVSLADELSAIREKMERLRSDKEKTEKMLRERELVMEMKMKEIYQRGEIQKVLEMEVDRLYRLNELRSLCNVSLKKKKKIRNEIKLSV